MDGNGANPERRRGGERWASTHMEAVLSAVSVDVLAAVVAIGVIVWVLATALYAWIILAETSGNGSLPSWYRWAAMGQQLSYAVWLGALAILVVKWLRERVLR
jgi:hypothetical protein